MPCSQPMSHAIYSNILLLFTHVPLRLQQNQKHAGASEEPCSNQNLCCYYICSFVYTDVKNNFHVCKNSNAPLINAALWHYLGTYNLDFRHENNSTPGVLIEEIRYLELIALIMQAGNSNSARLPCTITSFQPALLVQLIPNTTATHTITYTY